MDATQGITGDESADLAAASQRYRGWFAGTSRLRASTVIRLDEQLGEGAFAVLDPKHPRCYDANQIILPVLRPPALDDPGLVVAAADELLSSPRLAHRRVTVHAPVPSSWSAALPGWTREDFVGMTAAPDAVLDSAPVGSEGLISQVTEVTEEQVAPFTTAFWRVIRPTMDDATIAELVAYRERLDLAGRVHRLGILIDRHDGAAGLAATADVVIRGLTAELDAVGTAPEFRRRGLGDALVTAAARIAADAGCESIVLEALTTDWPADWYARRGFVTSGHSASLTLET